MMPVLIGFSLFWTSDGYLRARPEGLHGRRDSARSELVEKESASGFRTSPLKTCSGKLGITNYRWNFIRTVQFLRMFCQLHMRPRDMAKLGLLYMNGGTVERETGPLAGMGQSFPFQAFGGERHGLRILVWRQW